MAPPTTAGSPTAANSGFRWGLLVFIVAVVPIVSVNTNYVISARADLIPDCFVYLDGCTSISATGRYGVSYWLFKAFMLPQALLLALFWRRLARGLPASGSRDALLIAGLVGAAFLVLYTVFLGSQGDVYRLMRRYGVFVFFLGTFIAQILATRRLARSALTRRAQRFQQALLLLMGMLALAEIPLGTFGLQDDQAENVIEWNFSLAMQVWFASWLFVALPQREASARHD
ncbi:MAG: hypothetical protein AAFR09_04560 [Pseudomonadota bacterium]